MNFLIYNLRIVLNFFKFFLCYLLYLLFLGRVDFCFHAWTSWVLFVCLFLLHLAVLIKTVLSPFLCLVMPLVLPTSPLWFPHELTLSVCNSSCSVDKNYCVCVYSIIAAKFLFIFGYFFNRWKKIGQAVESDCVPLNSDPTYC